MEITTAVSQESPEINYTLGIVQCNCQYLAICLKHLKNAGTLHELGYLSKNDYRREIKNTLYKAINEVAITDKYIMLEQQRHKSFTYAEKHNYRSGNQNFLNMVYSKYNLNYLDYKLSELFHAVRT